MDKHVKYGELVCIYTGAVVCNSDVDAYNRLTDEVNKPFQSAEAANFYRDRRHQFLVTAMERAAHKLSANLVNS